MNSIISSVGIAFIFFVLLVLYTDYRIDLMRDRLFALRDQLFDDAKEGKIAFNSNAYIATRTMLNGMIRFAHKASVTRIMLIVFFGSPLARQVHAYSFIKAMNASSEKDRKHCYAYLRQADEVFAMHFATSPVGFVLILPFVAFEIFKSGTDFFSSLVTRRRVVFDAIDREAYSEVAPMRAVASAA